MAKKIATNINPIEGRAAHNPVPTKRLAPKKIFAGESFIKGYAASEIKQTLRVLLALNYEQQEQIYLSQKSTILEAIAARGLVKLYLAGDIETLMRIVAFTYGDEFKGPFGSAVDLADARERIKTADSAEAMRIYCDAMK